MKSWNAWLHARSVIELNDWVPELIDPGSKPVVCYVMFETVCMTNVYNVIQLCNFESQRALQTTFKLCESGHGDFKRYPCEVIWVSHLFCLEFEALGNSCTFHCLWTISIGCLKRCASDLINLTLCPKNHVNVHPPQVGLVRKKSAGL